MDTAINAALDNWYMSLMLAFAVAKVITILTPTPRDDAWWSKAYALVDLLALNVGKVKETGHYDKAVSKAIRNAIGK